METELKEILGKMSAEEIASWQLKLLENRFSALYSNCWWNPIALVLIVILQNKLKKALLGISLAKHSIQLRLRGLEKARHFADTLSAQNLFGKQFYLQIWCIHAFLSQFQNAYETTTTPPKDMEFAKKLFQALASVVRKEAEILNIEPGVYLAQSLEMAQEILRRAPA